MTDTNPMRPLHRHRNYRQMIDCWIEDKSIRILSGRFKISIEQATLISRIIDELLAPETPRGSCCTSAYKMQLLKGKYDDNEHVE